VAPESPPRPQSQASGATPHRSRTRPISLDDLPQFRQPLLDSTNPVEKYFGEQLKALQDARGGADLDKASASEAKAIHEAFENGASKIQSELEDPTTITDESLKGCEVELPSGAYVAAYDDLKVQREHFLLPANEPTAGAWTGDGFDAMAFGPGFERIYTRRSEQVSRNERHEPTVRVAANGEFLVPRGHIIA
jgi:hypothetical protein